jgi:hypothetical protein
MNIKIFAIGRNGESFMGTAHDAWTALSLLELVESKGGYAVSLHGNYGTPNAVSGELLLVEARSFFQKFTDPVDQQILNDAGVIRV